MADQNTDTITQDALAAAEDIQDLLDETTEPVVKEEAPDFRLSVSADNVTVFLDCPDPLAKLPTWVPKILTDFQKLEIPIFPDREQLISILQSICTPGKHLYEAPIIMGLKPVPPKNGELIWSREFFNEGWSVDEESGVIDFWEKLEDRAVHEDELLVKMVHPIDGEPGLNVFGNEIPVAKPGNSKLRCGKGAHTVEVEDGIEYYASVNGRVRFVDGTVSVDDVFLIQGNVSLATGNIHHTGAVQIQGDVESGATIEAEGDVMIKGMVDPCNITTGGTLTVAGGMVGSEDYQIKIEGDLNARYINEANITVDGDAIVSNEISHSIITALGKVEVVKGRIAGGQVQAYKGIRVAEAGASGAVDTVLIAGVDYKVTEQIANRKVKIKKLEEAQDKIQAALKELSAKPGNLDQAEQKVFSNLGAKAKQLGQTIADEYVLSKKLLEDSNLQGVFEVAMFQEVWSGTQIFLGKYKTKVRTSVQKPRIAQLRETRVRVLPMGEGNTPTD